MMNKQIHQPMKIFKENYEPFALPFLRNKHYSHNSQHYFAIY